MAKITKRRDGVGEYGPLYRVLADGRPTPITVTKAAPPKYAHTQMWHVDDSEGDAFLFDARSLEGAMAIIQTIARALAA